MMHNLTEEQVLRVKKWITALRSGEYEQGERWLQRYNPDTGKDLYCCLGIACSLTDVTPTRYEGTGIVAYDGYDSTLSGGAKQYYGIDSYDGVFYKNGTSISIGSLSGMNDSGSTFLDSTNY